MGIRSEAKQLYQLERWDDFSQQLLDIVDYPEVVMQQTNNLLSLSL